MAALKVGHRQGRRPADLRVEKSEIVDLVSALHARGLGSHTIASLIGYSENIVKRWMQDFNLERQTPRTITQAIVRNLPPELSAWCLRLRTKSDTAKRRRLAELGELPSARIHHLIDEGEDSCDKEGGAVRPEKAAA